MTVYETIEILRKAYGWSSYRLAQKADISQTTLTNMARRHNSPALITIEKICKGFGLSLSEFFNFKELIEMHQNQQVLIEQLSQLPESECIRIIKMLHSVPAEPVDHAAWTI